MLVNCIELQRNPGFLRVELPITFCYMIDEDQLTGFLLILY